jgi:hypothetical protein
MEIFISWHGRKSHAAAEALRDWLPQIVNAFKPWLSSHDIDKGTRWSSELATKLSSSGAGIICLTPGNLTAPWILFEAGALSKTVDTARVCPFLIDLDPSDVTGPLAQFQATKATSDHVLQLAKNLNAVLGKDSMQEAHIERAFEKWWPDLEKQLCKLPSEEHAQPPRRSEHDLLSEVVELSRQTGASLAEIHRQISVQFHNIAQIIRTSRNRDADGLFNIARVLERERAGQEETKNLLHAMEAARRENEEKASELARAAVEAQRHEQDEAAKRAAALTEALHSAKAAEPNPTK